MKEGPISMFLTLSQRLEKYISTHPYYNPDTVYQQVLQNHRKAIWKMQHRISERINHMINITDDVYFLTFTFDNEHLPSKQNELSTVSLIKKYLTSHNVDAYVANIDYGKKNGRFHWHAVVQSKTPFSHELWTQGAISFIKLRKSSKSLKLSRYLVKLKRHATKITDPLAIYYPFRYKK